MGWTDPANWDFVEYSKTLKVWNSREKEAADAAKQDGDVEDLSDGDTMPPSIEWMMADDQRLSVRGYEVN